MSWYPSFFDWSVNPDEGFIGPIQPGQHNYLTSDNKPPAGFDSWTDYALAQGAEQEKDNISEDTAIRIYLNKQNEENGKYPLFAKVEFYFIAILGLWAYSSFKK